jgi:hypothetical protein
MEPQPPAGQQRDVPVPGMGGVEGAAEQADARPPAVSPARQRIIGRKIVGLVQGRTWPLPVTR